MPTLGGYERVDVGEARADEMIDVDGWAFAGTVEDEVRPAFKGVLDWTRSRGIAITDDARGPVGALVAAHSSFPYEMRVPGGGTIETSGLTFVGVHSGHRRRGLLTEMIDDHFTRSLARGELVSTLFAAEPAIYQRFGYGLACPALTLTLPRAAALRPLAGAADLRIDLENADIDRHGPAIAAVLARSQRPGAQATVPEPMMRDVFIDPPQWRQGKERLRIAVVHDADGPAAFATFARKGDWGDAGPAGKNEVHQWAAVSAEATHRLFSVVADLDLMTSTRVPNVPRDAALVHLLLDVRAATPRLSDNLWVRLLDVPRALAARQYRADADVLLRLTDARMPANEGLWRVRIGGGSALVSAETRADALPDVDLAVQELSAAYLGGVTLAELAAAGLVTGDAEAIRQLSCAFQSDEAPVSPLNF